MNELAVEPKFSAFWKMTNKTQSVRLVEGCDASPVCPCIHKGNPCCSLNEPDPEVETARLIGLIRERMIKQTVKIVERPIKINREVLKLKVLVVSRGDNQIPADANYITCRFCGTRQSKYQRDCYKCGEQLGT